MVRKDWVSVLGKSFRTLVITILVKVMAILTSVVGWWPLIFKIWVVVIIVILVVLRVKVLTIIWLVIEVSVVGLRMVFEIRVGVRLDWLNDGSLRVGCNRRYILAKVLSLVIRIYVCLCVAIWGVVKLGICKNHVAGIHNRLVVVLIVFRLALAKISIFVHNWLVVVSVGTVLGQVLDKISIFVYNLVVVTILR